jgi:hypothetical protein
VVGQSGDQLSYRSIRQRWLTEETGRFKDGETNNDGQERTRHFFCSSSRWRMAHLRTRTIHYCGYLSCYERMTSRRNTRSRSGSTSHCCEKQPSLSGSSLPEGLRLGRAKCNVPCCWCLHLRAFASGNCIVLGSYVLAQLTFLSQIVVLIRSVPLEKRNSTWLSSACYIHTIHDTSHNKRRFFEKGSNKPQGLRQMRRINKPRRLLVRKGPEFL